MSKNEKVTVPEGVPKVGVAPTVAMSWTVEPAAMLVPWISVAWLPSR